MCFQRYVRELTFSRPEKLRPPSLLLLDFGEAPSVTKSLPLPHQDSMADYPLETPHPGSGNTSGWITAHQYNTIYLLETSHTISNNTREWTTHCSKTLMELGERFRNDKNKSLIKLRNNKESIKEVKICLEFYYLEHSVHVNVFIEYFI